MRIDPTDPRLAMRASEEAVIAARARARQTAEDAVRFRDLVARRAVSASENDQARAAAESARADLSAAEARAQVARNEASYAVLLADADGVVLETSAEPGQVVAAGQAVVRVARAGQREALVELPETLRLQSDLARGVLVWERAEGLRDTAPVVGCGEPSDSERSKHATCWKIVSRTHRWARPSDPDPRCRVRRIASGADRRRA